MKTYKNVGVYKLCRMFPEDTTRFPIGEANKIIQENAPRTFITEDDINFFEEVWDNHTVYYDFAVYGKICERKNLTRLIEDAKSGKIDHICIYSLWDFWHSPKKLVDTINELKSLSAPVGIRFYHCSTPCVFDKCTLNEKEYGVIIQESEKVEQIEKDFISAQSNKGILSRGLTRAVIKSHIDSIMLLEFFNDYFIIPFEPTWQEIQIELGTSEEDSMAIHDIWSPSEDGLNKIIKWGSQKILQYYLT